MAYTFFRMVVWVTRPSDVVNSPTQDVRLRTSSRGSASSDSLTRQWRSANLGVLKTTLTPRLRAFQLRRKVLREPGEEALETTLETAL